jgi:peptidoglycan/LPS O-acetylase OafA/YrhL
MQKSPQGTENFSPVRQSGTSRYAYIDSLRGLAAIAVLYLHAADLLLREHIVSNGVENFIFKALIQFFDIGKIGVIVFFAISGFVIPQSLVRQKNSVLNFAISRFFRLYPAYWLSIIMSVYFLFYMHAIPMPFSTIEINFTMLQGFFRYPNINGVYWTLQIELIFYALCVTLFLIGILARNNRTFLVSALLLCVAAIFALIRYKTQSKIPVALPLSLSIMFWGSLMRAYRVDHDLEARRYAYALTAMMVAFVPLISFLAYNFDTGFEETWYRYTVTYFAAIAIFYVLTGRFRLSGGLFSWLGRISYSVYLFHPIFVSITMDYVFPLFPSLPVSHVYIAIAATMTIVFAHFSYVLIEAPAINLGRALNAALKPRLSHLRPT